jgi:hypothetical protein
MSDATWPRDVCHGDGEQHCCCDLEEDCNERGDNG